MELVCVARKPLEARTIHANVLAYGTGAINIDACRVETGELRPVHEPTRRDGKVFGSGLEGSRRTGETQTLGRHPANVIHDGSEEVEAAFARFGERGGGSSQTSTRGKLNGTGAHSWGFDGHGQPVGFGDSGTASRFFYSAKATADDRHGSKHPTVKPTDLMRYLCKLVTPPGGTVLDPFCGTGSTLLAADQLQFHAIGIEQDETYAADARRKFEHDAGLFAEIPR